MVCYVRVVDVKCPLSRDRALLDDKLSCGQDVGCPEKSHVPRDDYYSSKDNWQHPEREEGEDDTESEQNNPRDTWPDPSPLGLTDNNPVSLELFRVIALFTFAVIAHYLPA